jgi:hypothetical protein
VGHEQPAGTTAAQHAASDEGLQDAVIFVLVVDVVILVGAVPQQIGQDDAAHTATTQHPAADQGAQDAPLVIVVDIALLSGRAGFDFVQDSFTSH